MHDASNRAQRERRSPVLYDEHAWRVKQSAEGEKISCVIRRACMTRQTERRGREDLLCYTTSMHDASSRAQRERRSPVLYDEHAWRVKQSAEGEKISCVIRRACMTRQAERRGREDLLCYTTSMHDASNRAQRERRSPVLYDEHAWRVKQSAEREDLLCYTTSMHDASSRAQRERRSPVLYDEHAWRVKQSAEGEDLLCYTTSMHDASNRAQREKISCVIRRACMTRQTERRERRSPVLYDEHAWRVKQSAEGEDLLCYTTSMHDASNRAQREKISCVIRRACMTRQTERRGRRSPVLYDEHAWRVKQSAEREDLLCYTTSMLGASSRAQREKNCAARHVKQTCSEEPLCFRACMYCTARQAEHRDKKSCVVQRVCTVRQAEQRHRRTLVLYDVSIGHVKQSTETEFLCCTRCMYGTSSRAQRQNSCVVRGVCTARQAEHRDRTPVLYEVYVRHVKHSTETELLFSMRRMYGTSSRAQRQNSCVVRGVFTARQAEHCDRTPVLYEVYVLHVKKSTVTELLCCTRCMYCTSSRAQRQNSCVVRGVCTARQAEHRDRTPVLYEVYVRHVKQSTETELLCCTRCIYGTSSRAQRQNSCVVRGVCTARQEEHCDRTPVLYEVYVLHVKKSTVTELLCCTRCMYGTSSRAQRQNSCVVRGVCTARQAEHRDRTPVLYEVYVRHVKHSTETELLFSMRRMYGTSSRAQRQNSCVVRGVFTARQAEHCDRTPVLYEVYVLHVKKSTVTELLCCTRCMYCTSSRAQRQNSCVVRGVCTARQAEHRDRTPVLYEVYVRHVKQSTETELLCCTRCIYGTSSRAQRQNSCVVRGVCTARQEEHCDRTPVLYEVYVLHVKKSTVTELLCCTRCMYCTSSRAQRQNSCVVRGVCTERQAEHCDRTPVLYEVYVLHVKQSTETELLCCTRCIYGTSSRAQRQNSCVVRGVCTARQEEHCDRTPVLYEVYVRHVKQSTETELLFCTRCIYGTSRRAQRQNSCFLWGVCTARQAEHRDRTPVLYEVYLRHVKKSTETELLFSMRCMYGTSRRLLWQNSCFLWGVCTARQEEHRDRTPVLYEVYLRHVKKSTETELLFSMRCMYGTSRRLLWQNSCFLWGVCTARQEDYCDRTPVFYEVYVRHVKQSTVTELLFCTRCMYCTSRRALWQNCFVRGACTARQAEHRDRTPVLYEVNVRHVKQSTELQCCTQLRTQPSVADVVPNPLLGEVCGCGDDKIQNSVGTSSKFWVWGGEGAKT